MKFKSVWRLHKKISIIFSTSQWNQDDYQTEMNKLPLVAEGPKFFEIWEKTLLFWLTSSHNKVYLVTPFLDECILKEFLYIVKKKNATAQIGKIIIREECDEEYVRSINKKRKVKFSEIEEKIKRECRDLFIVFTEKVLPNIVQKKAYYFHTKYIACVNSKTSTAEVLLTSANFNKNHLKRWDDGRCNRDSIGYHRISKEEFQKNIFHPIDTLI